jgi:hypothetical protein
MWIEAYQEGFQKGRQEGWQDMLLEVLVVRFGAVMPEIEAQIRMLDTSADFKAILKKALHCSDLAEFSKFRLST